MASLSRQQYLAALATAQAVLTATPSGRLLQPHQSLPVAQALLQADQNAANLTGAIETIQHLAETAFGLLAAQAGKLAGCDDTSPTADSASLAITRCVAKLWDLQLRLADVIDSQPLRPRHEPEVRRLDP